MPVPEAPEVTDTVTFAVLAVTLVQVNDSTLSRLLLDASFEINVVTDVLDGAKYATPPYIEVIFKMFGLDIFVPLPEYP